MYLFSFGLGYSAKTLTNDLLEEGWRVSGTHRTMEKCEQERINGITAFLFDEGIPLDNVWDANAITHILVSIPPAKDIGDIVLFEQKEWLKHLPNLKWIGYLSTTGVYGDHNGDWVDENASLNPPNDRTKRRVKAEQDWLNLYKEHNLPVHIFRLSGIYGPDIGRNAVDALKSGTAKRIKKTGQYFSRIHVEDIAQVLKASINNPNPGSIYNVADDEPCESADVIEYAAKILNIEPPAEIDINDEKISEMSRSFYQQNKRIKNDKIKQELGVKLKYKNYKEGLSQLGN